MKVHLTFDARVVFTSSRTGYTHVKANGVELEELLKNFELVDILACFPVTDIEDTIEENWGDIE